LIVPPSSFPPSFLLAAISLPSLVHNLAVIRKHLSPSCQILAVVKADAYGHGAVPIAHVLAQQGIRWFGVASVQEGIVLRESGFTHQILVMGGLLSCHLPALIHYHLTPVLSDERIAGQLATLLDSGTRPYPVHLKIDTGMRRMGFSSDAVVPFLHSSLFHGALSVEGLMTHLADADDPASDFTEYQLHQFHGLIEALKTTGLAIPLTHAANSAALLRYPSAHYGMVRTGIMLYGYAPTLVSPKELGLRPVLKLTTPIVHVHRVNAGETIGYNRTYRCARPSRIAILPIGYAHGLSRRLSNKGKVLIHGQPASIVGRVCMDMTLVDVTAHKEVAPGDEAVIVGEADGEKISAEDIAHWQGTIPYEVLCDLGAHAHRVYEPLSATAE